MSLRRARVAARQAAALLRAIEMRVRRAGAASRQAAVLMRAAIEMRVRRGGSASRQAAVLMRAAPLALAGVAFAAAAVGGCRGDDRAAIAERLRAKGAAEVVREAAATHYTPPADGRLTEAQVRLYLRVREREILIRETAAQEAVRRRDAREGAEPREGGSDPRDRDGRDGHDGREGADKAGGAETAAARASRLASASGSASPGAPGGIGGSGTAGSAAAGGGAGAAGTDDGLAAADLRAAQDLGVNPKEYSWVRDRVLEADAAATGMDLYQKMTAGRELLLAHMKRDMEAETDPEKRAAAAREIEDWRRGLQATEPAAPPAVRANAALLARFRPQLAHLVILEERALAATAGLDAAPSPAAKVAH